MITPAYLKQGDTVGIVATARKVTPAEIEPAVKTIESWGLTVVCGMHLYAEENQFAGSDELRTADIQQMLNNKDIKAIFCARGGYGTVRIIDKLDFSAFERHPKWIVGYSDITVLHSHIHRHFGMETLHATMPLNFPADGSTLSAVEAMKKALFGETPDYQFNPGLLSRNGHARGLVIGGNLSILFSLSGTPSELETEGKILFIEDLDEYLYHIDRMMMNLKRGGKLDRLAGLVVGGLSQMRDNTIPFGKTAEEIIADSVKEYKYPVLCGFPAGHQNENLPLILGREAVLDVNTGAGSLTFMKPDAGTENQKIRSLLKPLAFFLGFFGLLYLLYSLLMRYT